MGTILGLEVWMVLITRHVMDSHCLAKAFLLANDLYWYEMDGTCYGISLYSNYAYDDAQLQCTINDAKMAAVYTYKIHTFLTNNMEEDSQYWVGLTWDGTDYRWDNGMIPPTGWWEPGEPSSGGHSTFRIRYVPQSTHSSHLLSDYPESGPFAYICQADIRDELPKHGFGEEVTSVEAEKYITVYTYNGISMMSCALLCMNQKLCGLFAYSETAKRCILKAWASYLYQNVETGDTRYYIMDKACPAWFET